MSLFSQAFLAECRKGVDRPGSPVIYPIMDVEFPSGPRRLAKANVASDSLGPYEPLVLEWGTINRSVDPRSPTLQSVEVSPTIGDIQSPSAAHRFATEVARFRRSLRLSPATIRLASPNVAPADWFTAFTGVLDSSEIAGALSWRLRLKPNDAWLQHGVAPKPAFTPADWPNADPAVYGQFVPIIFGIHDSQGTGQKGMVPTFYVDRSGFRYALGLTQLKAVRAVYGGGSLVSTGDYAVTYPVHNGIQYTTIDFTSDRGEEVITCDVEGITDDGLSTGTLLTNPAHQLLRFLVAFGYHDHRSGALPLVSTVPIDEASFDAAAAFLDTKGHEGSRYIGGGEQVRVLEELESWLECHGLRAYWRGDGKLALGVNDHRTTAIYPPEPWAKAPIDQIKGKSLRLQLDSSSLLREVTVQYVRSQVSGQFHQSLRVQDLSVLDKTSRGLALPWSAARVL